MKDLWLQYRWNIIVAAGAVLGTVLLVVIILATLAIGGVWGPGWLGDLVDGITG